jgi:hypothetical protein
LRFHRQRPASRAATDASLLDGLLRAGAGATRGASPFDRATPAAFDRTLLALLAFWAALSGAGRATNFLAIIASFISIAAAALLWSTVAARA